MKEPAFFTQLQEKFTALSQAQKVLLFVMTILVLGAAFYFITYKDLTLQADRVKRNVAEQEKRLATLKQAVARVDSLKIEIAQAEADFENLLRLLPDQKELPGLLESVSELGAQVGLENILFQPQPEQLREFYAAIPVRLDLIGTFHELGVFLDKVSKLDRILKVENLSLTRQKGSPRLQVGCTVVTYRFIDKPPQAAAGGKKQ
ncbi:MAG: type 4a pilus biogenesis protein PilO [Deltaproteobacteria bacterium]|nr:type 4a pilus biogenesis protein PilO [Deltaproteobacteria bacterium]